VKLDLSLRIKLAVNARTSNKPPRDIRAFAVRSNLVHSTVHQEAAASENPGGTPELD
jgi:hypothetical protein